MSSSTIDDGPDQETVGPYNYGFAITFGFLAFLLVITYCYYIYSRYRSAAADHNPNSRYFFRRNPISAASTAATNTTDGEPERAPAAEGLNDAAILAFPKLLYSQAKSHDEEGGGDLPAAASGCSICLQDYKDTDLLRMLPDCGHFFHLKCVDPWLKLHPTCPICRNSPWRSPPENAAPDAAAVVLEMVPPSNR